MRESGKEIRALFGGASGSYCFSRKLQKLDAPPNGVATPSCQKLQKLTNALQAQKQLDQEVLPELLDEPFFFFYLTRDHPSPGSCCRVGLLSDGSATPPPSS
jgi:hypothetical protein